MVIFFFALALLTTLRTRRGEHRSSARRLAESDTFYLESELSLRQERTANGRPYGSVI